MRNSAIQLNLYFQSFHCQQFLVSCLLFNSIVVFCSILSAVPGPSVEETILEKLRLNCPGCKLQHVHILSSPGPYCTGPTSSSMSPSKPSFTRTQPETSTHNCSDVTKEVESDDKESLLMNKLKEWQLKEAALLKRHCMQRLKNLTVETEPRVTSFSSLFGAAASAMFSSPTYIRSTNITTGRFAPRSQIWHELRQQPKKDWLNSPVSSSSGAFVDPNTTTDGLLPLLQAKEESFMLFYALLT